MFHLSSLISSSSLKSPGVYRGSYLCSCLICRYCLCGLVRSDKSLRWTNKPRRIKMMTNQFHWQRGVFKSIGTHCCRFTSQSCISSGSAPCFGFGLVWFDIGFLLAFGDLKMKSYLLCFKWIMDFFFLWNWKWLLALVPVCTWTLILIHTLILRVYFRPNTKP